MKWKNCISVAPRLKKKSDGRPSRPSDLELQYRTAAITELG